MLLEASGQLAVGTLLEVRLNAPATLEPELGPNEVLIVAEVVRHGQPAPEIPFPVGVRFLSFSPGQESQNSVNAASASPPPPHPWGLDAEIAVASAAARARSPRIQ
jgi:hypothetical protein